MPMHLNVRRLVRIAGCVAVLLLTYPVTPAAFGQESAFDDLAFANALRESHYLFLAEEEYTRLAASGDDGDQKAQSQYGLCQVRLTKAALESEFEDRIQAFESAIGCIESLRAAYPDSPVVTEARLGIGQIYSRIGEAYMRESLVFDDESMRANAAEYYEKAIREFRVIQNDAKSDADLLRIARFYLVESYWSAAEASGKENYFKECDQLAEEFIWDYEPAIWAFHAYAVQGMTSAKLGEAGRSQERFEAVFDLVDEAAKAQGPLQDAIHEVLFRAYQGAIRAAFDRSDFESAIRSYEELKSALPAVQRSDFRQGAIYWAGRALEANGTMGQAQVVYQNLADQGFAHWAAASRARLQKLVAGGNSGEADPKLFFSLAQGFYAEGRYYEAVEQLQAAGEALQQATTEESLSLQAETYALLGDCFLRQQRNFESAIAYEKAMQTSLQWVGNIQGEEREKFLALAENTSFYAFRTLQQAYYTTFDPRLQEPLQRLREEFIAQFPKSPRIEDFRFEQAADLEKRGEYLQAAEAYQQVGNLADSYERARFRIGYCYYKLGNLRLKESEAAEDPAESARLKEEAQTQFEVGLGHLDEYIRFTQDPANLRTSEQAIKSRNSNRASTVLTKAQIRLALGAEPEAIETIYPEGKLAAFLIAHPKSHSRAYRVLIEAYCELVMKDLEAAKSIADKASQRAAFDEAREKIRWAESILDEFVRTTDRSESKYYQYYRVAKVNEAAFRLTSQPAFRQAASLYAADYMLRKAEEGRASSFGQAYTSGKRVMELALRTSTDKASSAPWRNWLRKSADVFGIALAAATNPKQERQARVRLARVYAELDETARALKEYSSLYQANPQDGLVLLAMADLYARVSAQGVADAELFGPLLEVVSADDASLVSRGEAEPGDSEIHGQLIPRIVELRSLLARQESGDWWSVHLRSQRKDELLKASERFVAESSDLAQASIAYGQYLLTEYKKSLESKVRLIESTYNRPVAQAEPMVRLLAGEFAVRLYNAVLYGLTEKEIPAELSDEFYSLRIGSFPTNEDWWQARCQLLLCYMRLGDEGQAKLFYDHLRVMTLPEDKDIEKMNQERDRFTELAEQADDPKEAETLIAKRDAYDRLLDRLQYYQKRLPQIRGEE